MERGFKLKKVSLLPKRQFGQCTCTCMLFRLKAPKQAESPEPINTYRKPEQHKRPSEIELGFFS